MPQGNDGNCSREPPEDDRIKLPRLPSTLPKNARIQPDRRQRDRDGDDRRQHLRALLDANARLAISTECPLEGRLYNLSAGGCSIRLVENSLKMNDAIWFIMDAIQPWKGTVRWVKGENVGVEFERPFYRAVFELIAQSSEPVAIARAA